MARGEGLAPYSAPNSGVTVERMSGAMEPVEHSNVLLILIDGLRADHVGCYG